MCLSGCKNPEKPSSRPDAACPADGYVSEPVRTGWRFAPDLFIKRLQERWPTAQVQELQGAEREKFSHEWKIRMPNGILEGSFNHVRSGLILDGDFKDAIAFALWFRSLVPAHQILQFYDKGYSMHVDLKAGSTEQDIVAAAGVFFDEGYLMHLDLKPTTTDKDFTTAVEHRE